MCTAAGFVSSQSLGECDLCGQSRVCVWPVLCADSHGISLHSALAWNGCQGQSLRPEVGDCGRGEQIIKRIFGLPRLRNYVGSLSQPRPMGEGIGR